MIDNDGYRTNVGLVIFNSRGQLFWARRIGQYSYQFPQGGIQKDEILEDAMYRELYEEVGLRPEQVEVIAKTHSWVKYKLPKKYIRYHSLPLCIGQKQKWFLLKLTTNEKNINLSASNHPEFESWKWVSYWYPIRQIVSFKQHVYRLILCEFSKYVLPYQI